VAAFRARQRRERKTKVQPSQKDRRKRCPRKKPGERYTARSYGSVLHQAITRYNRKAPADRQIPHWHLHQLRHTRALELKREFGLDVARAVLGQKSPVITEHYATLDIAAAVQAMGKIG
jgi:integrase